MDLNFIVDLYIPIVLVICLCVGYVIKNWLPTDNRLIPTIMLVLGAVLGCLFNHDITLVSVGSGMVTGLASTGLHQVFKQLLKLPMGDDEYYAMGNGEIVEEEPDDDWLEEYLIEGVDGDEQQQTGE